MSARDRIAAAVAFAVGATAGFVARDMPVDLLLALPWSVDEASDLILLFLALGIALLVVMGVFIAGGIVSVGLGLHLINRAAALPIGGLALVALGGLALAPGLWILGNLVVYAFD